MPMRSEAMVMGDLVLLETESIPVMAKLTRRRHRHTAVHNHLLRANPAPSTCISAAMAIL
jgi:hypothetical protein